MEFAHAQALALEPAQGLWAAFFSAAGFEGTRGPRDAKKGRKNVEETRAVRQGY